MLFRNDASGKGSLWRQFLASVDHLILHSALSNYSCYSEWSSHKDTNLAVFSSSLVEDAHIESYASRALPEVFATQAYANTLAYLRLKKPAYILNESMKAQTALLVKIISGQIEEETSDEMDKSIELITYSLRELKSKLDGTPMRHKDEKMAGQIDMIKLGIVNDIYQELEKFGKPPEVAALPHQEHHGGCHVFSNLSRKIPQEEFETLFERIYLNLGGPEDYNLSKINAPSLAGDNVFSKWEIKHRKEKKILNKYLSMVADGHFHSIGFPPEDYGKYLYIRSMMNGSTRRIIDQVSKIKNDLDIDFRVEAGMIDLQEAIQVIASQSKRSDVFTREDTLSKNEGWNIIVDMSNSIRGIMGETRQYATCLADVAAVALAEVTSGLTGPSEPWSMFGFSDRFYILKDYDEPYSSTVKARIGGVRPGGLTYLPDAMKIATKIIKSSSLSERNFMIIISDGLPAGYEGIENDLTKAISEVERAGILPLAVGLGTKSIKRYFRHYCFISDPDDLVKSYIRAYMELGS